MLKVSFILCEFDKNVKIVSNVLPSILEPLTLLGQVLVEIERVLSMATVYSPAAVSQLRPHLQILQ